MTQDSPRNTRYPRDHPIKMDIAETARFVARGKPRGTAEAGAVVPWRHGPRHKSRCLTEGGESALLSGLAAELQLSQSAVETRGLR
jgi:hypothetical protein